ncbi:MAG: phospho-N-acetylmuramoyl-pentapeptide-transferase [Christensenellales bacterium]|jgi:phospho-N-acetylmuramoyl-pentapeptide-transferase
MQYVVLSSLAAFLVCMIVGPIIIPLLRKFKFGQRVRDDGPQSHLAKTGTPTMGGLVMVAGIVVACLLFSRGSYEYTLFALLISIGFGIVGFLDDLIKIVKKRSLGLKAYQKVIGQFGLALVAALFAYNNQDIGSAIYVPLFNVYWDLGVFYVPVMVLYIVFIVNCVNLTDGLDGLASSVSLIVSAAFAIIFVYAASASAAAGNTLKGINLSNMAVFAGAVAGACLGFLRFNANPASVFMGDTGSMALGGALVAMAMVYGQQILLAFMGFLFVLSGISVILQVGSYKLRKGKRIFKMAPLHHHFELKGIKEQKIVAVYGIVTVVLCMLALLMMS